MIILTENNNSELFFKNNLVEGPRIVRLAAVVDRGFKKACAMDMNVFGSVCKGDL